MDFSQESLMHGGYISEDTCDLLLNVFHSSSKWAAWGTVYDTEGVAEVDKSVKESEDIYLHPDNTGLPVPQYREELGAIVDEYIKKYPILNDCFEFNLHTSFNIQHYPLGGGFKELHAEHMGNPSTAARVLVFMTYLNDVPNAGTYFPYQNITTEAKKGFTLIWPAYFTHPHVGVVSKTHEKYIVTGWIEFTEIFDMVLKERGLNR